MWQRNGFSRPCRLSLLTKEGKKRSHSGLLSASMTLEQALAFKLYGKQLRHMSTDDWHQWFRRFNAEGAMLAAMDERHITDEQDQHFHASADRLGDLMTALVIICAKV